MGMAYSYGIDSYGFRSDLALSIAPALECGNFRITALRCPRRLRLRGRGVVARPLKVLAELQELRALRRWQGVDARLIELGAQLTRLYIVMAYIVMALYSDGLYSYGRIELGAQLTRLVPRGLELGP